MANPCYNEFYANGSKENLEIISEFLKDRFNADVELDDELNAYFDSRWVFPEEQMEELFNSIPNKNDLFMRCLSVEYGCDYVAYHKCYNEGWVSIV